MKSLAAQPMFVARASRGFTIIELLVVMAILGVLAAAVMPLGEAMLVAEKERQLRRALWDIRDALDEYRRAAERGSVTRNPTDSGYPITLQALVEGVPDLRPGAQGKTLYFLRSLPRDPFADPSLPAAQTWRLRSYASSAERPEAGADVYDVRSSSNASALDGTAYASW